MSDATAEVINQCAECQRSYVVKRPTMDVGLCERHRRMPAKLKGPRLHSLLKRLERRYPGGGWTRLPGQKFYDNVSHRSCTLRKQDRRLYWDDTGDVVRL